MFTFRFLLGLGIGLKSTTIPIYASECVPANVRGTLVMMWQVFTAFGIMCGYFAGAAFGNVLSGNNLNICPNGGGSPLLLSTKCVSHGPDSIPSARALECHSILQSLHYHKLF